MRNFFVSVLMLVVAVDARRARRERETTSASSSDDGPPTAFTACSQDDDAVVVTNPRATHSKLPIDMLMAEDEDEELDNYMKWKSIYGGDDTKTFTDQAE